MSSESLVLAAALLAAAKWNLHDGANRQRTGVRQWPLQSARRNERDDNDCARAQ